MSIIGSNILAGASGQAGYNLNNSLRYRGSNSAYLSRTNTTNTSLNTWTWSAWVKRGTITSSALQMLSAWTSSSTNNQGFGFATNDTFCIYNNATTASPSAASTAVFRDPAAWYHVVVKSDGSTTVGYINGTQVVSYSGTIASFQLASNISVISGQWSRTGSTNSLYFDGYMTEINFVDGQALTPSSFGSTSTTTGSWIPAKYTGTYGTNGFYLNFSDTSAATAAAIGKDSSGNGNNWTPSGISVTAGITYDAMLDVPTNTSATVANYATLNPVYKANSQPTISNGNLTQTPTTTTYQNAFSTIGVTSGKWYVETTMAGSPNSANYFGIANTTQVNYLVSNVDLVGGTTGTGYSYQALGGQKLTNGVGTAYGAGLASGDVLGIAFDADAGTLTFYKNGVSQGIAFTGIDATTTFFFGGTVYTNGVTSVSYNFGQRPFSYSPPTGYVALNTYNLPTPTILQGNKYMDATLYTGTGATLSVTNASAFKPDFVWIKCRSSAFSHNLTDSNRGVLKASSSDTTSAEANINGATSAFNSNGFSVTSGSSGIAEVSNSASTYVGWQWQAGQGTTTAGTGTGGITSVTQSVNTTAGFSIVTYTGSGTNGTVTHGLGVAPSMILAKSRSLAADWNIYHTSLGATKALILNRTIAASTSAVFWNNTAPTSSVFSLGTTGDVNTNASTNVAYCFAEIAGFSKFGSYTGNGSTTDGPFVYTGFRPKFVMIKDATNAATQWEMLDSSRNTYNIVNSRLLANLSNAESTESFVDLLSNGFKVRPAFSSTINNSGATLIYMAFAENPFKNANAR